MRILFTLAAVAAIGAAPNDERIVRGDGVVTGSVNGVPARIRIDPGTVAVPLVTSALARRAGLKPSKIFEFEYQIGARKVELSSAVGRIDFGSGPIKRRIGFTDVAWAAGVDGVIGPGLLPEKRIRFQLRPQRPGERVSAFKMVGQGGLEGRWGERFALVEIGSAPVRVHFDPNRRLTVATASAGARIAAANGGAFSGQMQRVEIAFGVERPVRTLKLASPLAIGTLEVRSLGVRTSDFGSVRHVPEETARPADPEEIVVTAKGKKQKSVDQLKLGSDLLDRCSSIVFDREAKQIRLSCL